MSDFECWVPVLSFVDEANRPMDNWIASHLAWLKAQQADGILVMGTTGEFSSLSVAERQHYLEALCQANPGLPVMVNIGASALSDVLALQAHALQQPGVTHMLLMPPFYFPLAQLNGLPDFVDRVLSKQPETVPFYLYHHPKLSQVPIEHDLLHQFPGLAGIKDSSGDLAHIEKTVQAFPQLKIYSGTDTQIAASRQAGCAGVISALANLVPQWYRAAAAGDASAFSRLTALKSVFRPEIKIPAMKACMPHLLPGAPSGRLYSVPPLSPLSPESEQAILEAVASILNPEPSHAAV